MPHTPHSTGPAFVAFSWRTRLLRSLFSRGTDCGEGAGWPGWPLLSSVGCLDPLPAPLALPAPLLGLRHRDLPQRAPVRAVAEVARAPLTHRHYRRAQPLRNGPRPESLVHEPSVPRVEGGIGHGVGGERQLTERPARSTAGSAPPLGVEDGGEACLEVPCGHAKLLAAVLRR